MSIPTRSYRDSVFALVALCILGSVAIRAADAQDESQARNHFIQAFDLRQAGNKQAAFRLFLKSAELGYLDAQFQAGFHYEFGEGVEKDLKEAVRWYTKAAERGEKNAAQSLGRIYEYGDLLGIRVDLEQARRWYNAALKAGHPDAKKALETLGKPKSVFDVALAKKKAGDLKGAFELYQKAADQGDELAYALVGYAHQLGQGTKIDYLKAAQWHYKAATEDEMDRGRSGYQLASLYAVGGHGLKQDQNKSREWLRFAAGKGHADAAQALKELDQGKNRFVIESLNSRATELRDEGKFGEAMKVYSEALEQGDSDAAVWIGRMVHRGGEGLKSDTAEAKNWFRKAAELGNKQAPYWLQLLSHPANDDFLTAERLRIGFKDEWIEPVTASRGYHRAAEQGHAAAQEELGDMYDEGTGVFRDGSLARAWTLKAAEQGDAEACWNAGFLLEERTPKDRAEAIKWYKRAIELGFLVESNKAKVTELERRPPDTAEDYRSRGLEYKDGFFVLVDVQRAIDNSKKAAAMGNTVAWVNLGSIYDDRSEKHADRKQAFDYYLQAAQASDPNGCALVAFRYENGDVIRRDLREAIRWARRAWELGYRDQAIERLKNRSILRGEAEYVEGLAARHLLNDLETARKHFLVAAEAGHPIAPRQLTTLATDWETWRAWAQESLKFNDYVGAFHNYDFPPGAPGSEDFAMARDLEAGKLGRVRDLAKAVELYRRAAEKGHPIAMNNLGLHFSQGRGIRQDDEAAFALFKQAAEAGYRTLAMNNLGLGYLHALGVDADLEKGRECLAVAARNGYPSAIESLKEHERLIATPAGKAYWLGEGLRTKDGGWRDAKRAAEHYRRAAELGYAPAMSRLGELYLGDYLRDPQADRAIEWLTRAAEAGDKTACRKLGDLFRSGEQVEEDRVAARRWYREGIKAGDASLEEQLREMDHDGLPGEPEYREARDMLVRELRDEDAKAIELLQKAAAQGHRKASRYLGSSYLEGRRVDFNGALARKWLKQAADQYSGDACFLLGIMYGWGLGGERGVEAARLYLTRAENLNIFSDLRQYMDSLDRGGYLGEQQYRAGVAAMNGWLETRDYKKAQSLLKQAAELGHHPARVQLAKWHVDGVIDWTDKEMVRQLWRAGNKGRYGPASTALGRYYRKSDIRANIELAESILQTAIDLGDEDAPMEMLRWREDRVKEHPAHELFEKAEALILTGDKKAAQEAMLAAAEKGHPSACVKVGYAAHLLGDQDLANQWYLKGADAGDLQSLLNLGNGFLHGSGVDRDLKKAAEYFREAAEQGYPGAQTNLGYCYHKGLGVEKDLAEAKRLYRSAGRFASQTVAMQNLGWLWLEDGEEINLNYAENWFRRAIRYGRPDSDKWLGACLQAKATASFRPGTDVEFDEESLDLLRLAAERGWTKSQGILAVLHDLGLSVERDKEEARRWYTYVVENNDFARERLEKLDGQLSTVDKFLLLTALYANLDDDERAATYHRAAADASDTDDLVYRDGTVGRVTVVGTGTRVESLSSLTDAANFESNADATKQLSERYFFGVGGPVDLEKAREYARKAYYLGFRYRQGEEWDTLFTYTDKPGHEDFCRGYRMHAANNVDKAAELYRKAADAGHPGAMRKLSFFYTDSSLIALDDEQWLTWLRKAGDAGDYASAYQLGLLYHLGRFGVEKNVDVAEVWYRKAKELGSTKAESALHLITAQRPQPREEDRERGWEAYERKDLDEAAEYLGKAAAAGNSEAQRTMGYVERNRGNHDQSIAWFRKSIEAGDWVAPWDLAQMFEHGTGVEKDTEHAIELYTLAARRGWADAERYVAYCYQKGEGVEKDYEKAIFWYLRAKESKKSDKEWQGDVMSRLARCFEYPTPERHADRSIAMYWYRKSAALGDEYAKERVAELEKYDVRITEVPEIISDEVLTAARVWAAGNWGKARKDLGLRIIKDAPPQSNVPSGAIRLAKTGDKQSQLFVSRMYLKEGNLAEAKHWAQQAKAQDLLSEINEKMKASGVNDEPKPATEPIPLDASKPDAPIARKPTSAIERDLLKAAESGSGPAMYSLASYYANKKLWAEAKIWAERADEKGAAFTKSLLARIDRNMTAANSTDKPKDEDTKITIFTKPPDTNSADVERVEVTIDPGLIRAAEAGFPPAMFELAKAYADAKKWAEAKKWVQKLDTRNTTNYRELLEEIEKHLNDASDPEDSAKPKNESADKRPTDQSIAASETPAKVAPPDNADIDIPRRMLEAAERGVPSAQMGVALKYLQAKKWDEAKRWAEEANKKGFPPAKALLERIQREMDAAGVPATP